MRLRPVVLPLIVLAAAGGLVLLEGRGGPRPEAPSGDPPPRPVARPGTRDSPHHPQPVHVRTVPRTESLPATVSGGAPVPLFSDLRAPFVEIPVREGQAVRSGDLLARADVSGVQRARAEAEKRGDAKEAARLAAALGKAEIRAPVDGVVHRIHVSLGDMPPPPSPSGPRPVAVLYDWRTMALEATVPAALASLAVEGAEVLYTVGGPFPGRGRIERAGPPAADGSVAVTVRPGEPPGEAPEPGAKAEILLLAGTHECLAVPMAALVQEGGRTVVFEVGITGDLTPRPVGAGVRFPDGFIEITGVDRGISVAVWEVVEKGVGRR